MASTLGLWSTGIKYLSLARRHPRTASKPGLLDDTNPGEDITFAYGPLGALPAFLTVGAEDITGTVGATSYFNGSGTGPTEGGDLRVTSADLGAGARGARTLYPRLDRPRTTWSRCDEAAASRGGLGSFLFDGVAWRVVDHELKMGPLPVRNAKQVTGQVCLWSAAKAPTHTGPRGEIASPSA